MAEELYEAAGDQVSQGDILQLAPDAHLAHPLTRLRPIADGKFESDREPFPDFNEKRGETVAATCKRRLSLLLTPDCEIDKANRKWVICPIRPIGELFGNFQDSIRKNRVVSALFLPAHKGLFPDGYADFNYITTLEPEFVQTAKRPASLSDVGRIALYKQYIRWFTRWTLKDIPCPNCGMNFDPTLALKVR